MIDTSSCKSSRRRFLAATGLALGAAAASPLGALAQTAGGAPLKIGTIGAGHEGGALGTLYAKAGHPVMFSSRNPEGLKDLVAEAGPTAQAGTVAQAVAFGDVIILAVPYPAVEQIGRDHDKALASKRLVMDVSNPIALRDGYAFVKGIEEQGGPGLVTAKLLPGARIVRAFNAISYRSLAPNAHRSGEPLGIPIAGDDAEAIALATSLIREIGFEPVVVGGLAMGKYLVPGTRLDGEHTPAEIRQIAATLK